MFYTNPVMIPEAKGKLSYMPHGEDTYVRYETGRRYVPEKQYTIVSRRVIGVVIPGRPEMMYPNDNYRTFFPEEENDMEKIEKIQEYVAERDNCTALKDLFINAEYEFQYISRKNPGGTVSAEQVRMLNEILRLLQEMMKDEPSGPFLRLIEEPVLVTKEDGSNVLSGMSYSDAEMILTIYKAAVHQYFRKRM